MSNETEGFDICYECGVVQEYGTMQDINEFDFDVLCVECFKKKVAKYAMLFEEDTLYKED